MQHLADQVVVHLLKDHWYWAERELRVKVTPEEMLRGHLLFRRAVVVVGVRWVQSVLDLSPVQEEQVYRHLLPAPQLLGLVVVEAVEQVKAQPPGLGVPVEAEMEGLRVAVEAMAQLIQVVVEAVVLITQQLEEQAALV
jgi:hypothetical protein